MSGVLLEGVPHWLFTGLPIPDTMQLMRYIKRISRQLCSHRDDEQLNVQANIHFLNVNSWRNIHVCTWINRKKYVQHFKQTPTPDYDAVKSVWCWICNDEAICTDVVTVQLFFFSTETSWQQNDYIMYTKRSFHLRRGAGEFWLVVVDVCLTNQLVARNAMLTALSE